jgi:serine kinase of HPr protein (carbohydrate metabolism regulator)
MSNNIHASCIALGEEGVIILGTSGAGKSDLALRLVDEGAGLVSDDYVALEEHGNEVSASPPPTIEGLIEVRGLGLINVPFVQQTIVHLVVELVDRDAVPRLPDPDDTHYELLPGHMVPMIRLSAFDPSTPAKIRLAVRALRDGMVRTSL